jgi:hypothetical protein
MTTIEKNTIIARFQDCKIVNGFANRTNGKWDFPGNDSGIRCACENLKYHYSWDWLMPVAHRVVNYPDSDMSGAQSALKEALCTVDLIGAWEAVVHFINWYNIHVL